MMACYLPPFRWQIKKHGQLWCLWKSGEQLPYHVAYEWRHLIEAMRQWGVL